jgi:hypothetical protein
MLSRVSTMRFSHLAQGAAVICSVLAAIWLCTPQFLLAIWSVSFSEATALVCRRSGALFAGIAFMLFQLRHAPPSPVRTAVANGITVGCSILALLGLADVALGHAGAGMFLAVAVEVALAAAFMLTKKR